MADDGQIATDPPAPTPADDHPSTLAPAENLPDDARTLAARASTAEPPAPERLLRRVADQLRASFQNALDKVVADVSSEFGLPTTMEKGGAVVTDSGGESDAVVQRLLETSSENDAEDVRLLVQELRAARSRVRELQQIIATLEKDKQLADDRVALHSTLVKKLTRELVDERLAHIDTKREVDELRHGAGGSTGGDDIKSSRSPLQDREASNNPWTSPGKPVGSVSGTGAGSVMSPPPSSKLMGFNFYSSEQQGGEDELPSPSSSTHTLRGTLMGQFLPSSLLDSPQMTPTRAKSFRSDDASELTLLTEQKRPAESDSSGDERENTLMDDQTKTSAAASTAASAVDRLSLSSGSISSRRRSSLGDNQTDHTASDASALETKQSHSGTLSLSHTIGRRAVDTRLIRPASSASFVSGSVSPLKLSMLSEVFDAIPVEELEAALVRSNNDEAAAIDHLVRTHASFNPGQGSISSGFGASGVGTEGSGSGAVSSSLQTSSTLGGGGGGHGRGQRGSSGERMSGSGSGSSGPGGSNWKTEICMYYMQGKCNKTRRTCSFAHGESDLARPAGAGKPGYKTRLCPAYENGVCPKSRRDCPNAHGVNDLRDPGASSTSAAAAAAAIAAAIPGGVNNPALLPPPTPRLQSYKTELCYYYLKGNCNYTKEECRFAHGPGDLRTVESNTIAQMNAAAAAAAAFTAGAPGPGVSVGSAAAAASTSPSVSASFDKQLQWQHQYQPPPHLQQQQQQMTHQPPGYSPHQYLPASHQLQGHRGSGGVGPGMAQSFGYQPPPPPPPLQSAYHQQQQQQQHHLPSPHAQPFRYLKPMDELPKRGGRGSSGRRDAGGSWSGYDAPGLPPPEF